MKPPTKVLGFTLIELSIVLVIIGLIAGGVLVGKELIRAAQLRSIIKDAERLHVAVNTFMLKYSKLPGDMDTAESIWGADDLCPDDSTTPTVPKIPTCNGNGDGLVRDMRNGTESYEVFRALQQLSNAGLIPGVYTGVTGPLGVYDTIIGLNIPRLKNFEAGMLMVHNDPQVSSDHLYPGPYRLMVHIGADDNTVGWDYQPFLMPEDAYAIDSKADDGKPGLGMWKSYRAPSYVDPDPPYCTSDNDPEIAVYNYTEKEITCSLVYIVNP